MHLAQLAFINEIKKDAADNARLIGRIICGARFYNRGVDVTAECLADARRRLSDACLILAAYA